MEQEEDLDEKGPAASAVGCPSESVRDNTIIISCPDVLRSDSGVIISKKLMLDTFSQEKGNTRANGVMFFGLFRKFATPTCENRN